MIESEEFKDDLVSDFVKSGAKNLMNKDFESNMILKIKAEIDYRKEVSSYLKKSLSFFLVALFSGILFMFSMLFEEYVVKSITILILFAFSIFGLLCLDNYRIIIKKYFW